MFDRNAFRAELARNGMTQRELCEKTGISTATMTRKIRSGKFGTDDVEKIVKVLNIKDPAGIFLANIVTH